MIIPASGADASRDEGNRLLPGSIETARTMEESPMVTVTRALAGTGYLDLPAPNLHPVAGIDLFLQTTIVDDGAPQGVSLTSGLLMSIRP